MKTSFSKISFISVMAIFTATPFVVSAETPSSVKNEVAITQDAIKKANPRSKDLNSLLTDAERKAIEKEAALQSYRESKGEEDPKRLDTPKTHKNEYTHQDQNVKTHSSSQSASKSQERASSSSLRRRSFTTYRPGSQTPARNLKATPRERSFGK